MPLANILGVDFFNESFDFPKWEIVPKTTLATIIRTKKGTDISLFLLLTENILLILIAAQAYPNCIRRLIKPIFEHAFHCVRTV